MRLARWVVIPVAVMVGCGDPAAVDDRPLSEERVDAVLTAGNPTGGDLPDSFDWEASDDNPVYLDDCADAATALVASAPGVVSTRRSESFAGDQLGDNDDLSDPSFVRVLGSVTVFGSGSEASSALQSFDDGAFAECMQDGIASEVRGYEEEVSGAGDTGDIDFDTRSESPGDESTLHSAYFPASVVAGYDDFGEVDVSVTRVGPTVLVIALSASAQNLSRGAAADLTLDIADTLADQTQAALD